MAATLGYYNPQFYAAEALNILMKRLGIASRVYHGFEKERAAFGKGDTINIRRPGLLAVGDAPQTAQDVVAEGLSVVLDRWKEVKFQITDRELSLAQEVIIQEHIAPAAYALADYIDIDLATGILPYAALNYSATATTRTTAATAATAHLHMVGLRRQMFDARVPMQDASKLHCMINSTVEAAMLQSPVFNTEDGSGDTELQETGIMTQKFGINWFANQNSATNNITASTQANATFTINGAITRGQTTFTTNADGTISGVLRAGAILKIGSFNYRVTTTTTADGSGIYTNVPIDEAFHEELLTGAVVTPVWLGASTQPNWNMPFWHQQGIAFVSAPLSEMGNELGAHIFQATDPVTGITIRARIYYVGKDSKVDVALDVLYGFKVVNNNLVGIWRAA